MASPQSNKFNPQVRSPTRQQSISPSIGQQVNGASLLITDKTNIRPNLDRRTQHNSTWGDNPNNDSFVALLKILQSDIEGIKLQQTILRSRNETKDHLMICLKQFSPDKDNDSYYNQHFKQKPHLGLTMEELGFKKSAVLEACTDLDLLWSHAIDVAAYEFSTSKLTAYRALRRLAQQDAIFKNLYSSQIAGQVYKPKIEQINMFFKTGTKNIDEEFAEFKLLLSRLSNIYYQEFTACIQCLMEIFEQPKYQGFKRSFEPTNDYSLLKILWDTYCKMSRDILELDKATKISQRHATYASFKKQLVEKKLRTLELLLRLFLLYLTNFTNDQRPPIIPNDQNFISLFVKQLDEDIILFEKSEVCRGSIPHSLIRLIVDLFLMLFPFRQERRDHEKLKKITGEMKSEQLQLVKILFSGRSAEFGKTIKQFQEIANSGEWNALDAKWKKWLGIFLMKFKQHLNKYTKQLTKKIISLCKIVVKQNLQEFWSEKTDFYLQQIKIFLREIVSAQYQCTTINDISILPIFTKLLGRLAVNCSENVVQFLDAKLIENIFNSITSTLKLDTNKNQSQKHERIIYLSQDQRKNMEQNLEQEIKFICRLVELQADNLSWIEQILLFNQNFNQNENSTGTILIINLLQIFYSVPSDTVSGLKCLRYLIKTISSLFVCRGSRNFVCIALAILDSGKQNHSKSLKSIVNSCFDYDRTSELGRQAEKLRKTISYHINYIVRISDTLEQYFPSTTQREASHLYKRLHEYLVHENIKQANELIKEINQQCTFGFRSVQWFYQFAKLLQSDRLNDIDLDTIRLFLMKMRIKNQELREYSNLSVIVDILNHGNLQQIIINLLTPIFKRSKEPRDQETFFLGLANKQLQSFMSQGSHQKQCLTTSKYSNKAFRYIKEKYLYQQEKYQLYGKLSGCLSIIETLLRLTYEGDFPLLKKLKVNNFIYQSLFSDKPYMYNVKFIFTFEKPREQNTGMAVFLKKERVEREISSSVNLIHCIASFWDLENRLKIDENYHPSNSVKLSGHLSIDMITKQYTKDVIYFSQQSVLTDINRKGETIGVSTISKILQYIILLGGGKTLYYSIVSRNYPINKGMIATSSNLSVLDQFMTGIAETAIRRNSSLREREHVLELFSVFIRDRHFGEYLHANIFRFKEALSRGKQFADISRSSRLIAQMLHCLNMLLSMDPGSANIKFVKSCLSDPVEFGMKLLAHCQNRIGQLVDIEEKAKHSKYGTFHWVLSIREAAVCKLSLLLFLGIASYIISNEHHSLTLSLTNLILKNSSIFLKTADVCLPEEYSNIFQKLQLKESLKAPKFQTSDHSTHLAFNDIFLNSLLLNLPISFIDSYLEQPWQVLQNSLPKEGKKMVLATHRYNSLCALHYANEALVQYYYLLLDSIFNRGQSGIFFINECQKKISKKIPSIILFKKLKSKNEIASDELVGEGEGFSNCCFRICRDIQKQIWQPSKSYIQRPRDVGLILITDIINSLEARIADQPQYLTECRRIIEKVISYLRSNDHRFHSSVIIKTVHSIHKLSQRMFQISILKKENLKTTCQSYFKKMDNCIVSMEMNICFDSLGKVFEEDLLVFVSQCLSLFESQIENIQFLQKNNHDIISYIQSEDRVIVYEKIKKIAKILIPFLALSQSSLLISALVLQLLSKAITIDYLSNKSRLSGIIRPISKQIFAKIEKISQKISNQDELLITYLLKFIAEISFFAQNEQNRQIMKILKTGFEKLTFRFEKIADIKTLSETVKTSKLLGAFASLSLEQNWKNQEFQNVLDYIFITIQEKPFQFLCQKVIPVSEIQLQLNNKILKDLKRSKPLSIFSVYVQFCMYELINNYLLFLSFAIKYSPNLHELCNNTFNKGLLEDLSLDRLRESLANVIQFMSKFATICFNCQIEEILKIHSFASIDSDFLKEMNLLSLCVENYNGKSDFYSSIFDTLALLHETINLLCQTWEKYDWKSIADWRINRKDLIMQFQKLIILYKGFFRDNKQKKYEKYLTTIGEHLRIDLEYYNF